MKLRKLLSVLLVLCLLASLFPAAALAEEPEETVPPAEEQAAASEEPDEEQEEEATEPAPTRDGGSAASFRFSGPESIVIRDENRIQVTFTLDELNLGTVAVAATDDTPAYETQAVALYFGTMGYTLEDASGSTMSYWVADGPEAELAQYAFTEDFTPDDVPAEFSFYLQPDEWDWLLATMHPSTYTGSLIVVGYWICEDGTQHACADMDQALFVPITAYVPSEYDACTVNLPEDSDLGAVTADITSAVPGVTVTLTASPADDCELLNISAMDASGLPVELTSLGNGKYSFVMPGFDVTVSAEFTASWSKLQQRINAASNGATITLNHDYTATSSDTALLIASDKRLTLDLNGHTLDRNLTAPTTGGNVITNMGTLTIADSSGGDGLVRGAYNSDSGGAVANYGTLTIENGNFQYNYAKEAGGVYNASGATLTMNYGYIGDNHATVYGGGGVVNYGTMTLNGGYVNNNTAPMNGGGIWTAGTLNLNDGSISYNRLTGSTSHGGGVYFKQGTLNIGGDIVVYGNEVEQGDGESYTNNLHLLAGNKLTVTGAIDYAHIGVTSEETQLPIVITQGLPGKGDSGNFSSDDSARRVGLNDDDELVLKDNLYDLRIDSQMTGGTVTANKARYAAYEDFFLTVTPDEGMKLKRLYYTVAEWPGEEFRIETTDEQGRYTSYMPSMDITVHALFVPDVEEYYVWLGDTQVSAANKDNILGNSGTPKAVYDPETHTLTLRSPNITGGDDTDSLIYAYGQDLIIVAETPLTLTATQKAYYAIQVEYGNLTLRGTINAYSDYDHVIRVSAWGEEGGNIVIEGSLTAACVELPWQEHNPYASGLNYDAIHVDGSITLTETGSLTARAVRHALYSDDDKDIVLLGSSVSLESAEEAVRTDGTVILDCSGTITSHGDEGIRCGDLLIRGGTLTVSCDDNGSNGIYASGNMTIEGGTLTAIGDSRGIRVGETLTLKRSITRLTAEGGAGAIRASDGIILDYILVESPAGAVLRADAYCFVTEPGGSEEVTSIVLVPDPNAPVLYHVTVDSLVPAGMVTADKTEAVEGETVTLTVSELGTAKLFAEFRNYKDQMEEVYDLQQVDENTWTFTMPYNDVTVSVKYKAEAMFPEGITGIRILSMRIGEYWDEGETELYARPGETVTVSFQLADYYEIQTLSLSYISDGAEVVEAISATYYENSGRWSGSFTMPAAPATVTLKVDSPHPWKALQALINNSYGELHFTLKKDIVAEADDVALVIPEDKTVFIDLAGFTLDRGLADGSAEAGGNVLTVNGTLTVTDSSAEETGCITGGNSSDSGGGIVNAGTLTVNGCIFTGNVAKEGGAIANSGTLTVNGGTFTNNTTNLYGGAGILNMGSMTMTGGEISGNAITATGMNGAGIWTNNSLTISGGIITDNTTKTGNGGGIYFRAGTLSIEGSPVISGNTGLGAANNLFFDGNYKLTVSGELTGALIGVSGRTAPTANAPWTFTDGLSGKGTAEHFFSDNDSYAVRVIDGEANLVLPVKYSITVGTVERGTVTVDKKYAAEGETVTLTVTPEEGYALASLTRVTGDEDHFTDITDKDENGNYYFIMPAGNVAVTAKFERLPVTVRFDACGGTVEPASVEIDVGAAVGTLPVPERVGGWVFLGWFTEPAASYLLAGQGSQVTAETSFTADATIYAHWRLPGDINGDGKVTNKDVTALQRRLKYGDVQVMELNLDVNGDGKPSNKDVTALQRYIKYKDVEIH